MRTQCLGLWRARKDTSGRPTSPMAKLEVFFPLQKGQRPERSQAMPRPLVAETAGRGWHAPGRHERARSRSPRGEKPPSRAEFLRRRLTAPLTSVTNHPWARC